VILESKRVPQVRGPRRAISARWGGVLDFETWDAGIFAYCAGVVDDFQLIT
jgi:hypothetical protein